MQFRALIIGIVLATAACGVGGPPRARMAFPDATVASSEPAPARNDELAADYAAMLEGRTPTGAVTSMELKAYIDRYANSPSRARAFIELGDILMAQVRYDGDLDGVAEAKTFYREAMAVNDPRTTLDAASKLGRALVICGEYDEAVAAFKSVIDRTRPTTRETREIRDRALVDLAGAVGYLQTPSEAYAFFAKLTDDSGIKVDMLIALVATFESLGDYPACMSVYDELRYRDTRHACTWTVRYRHASPMADATKLESDLAKCHSAHWP